MKFLPALALLLLTVGLSNCKKIDTSEITQTDDQGQLIGNVDETDWRTNEKWSKKEEALFEFADDVNLSQTKKETVEVSPAFPNPATDNVVFPYYLSNSTSLIKFVVTDEKMIAVRRFAYGYNTPGFNHGTFKTDGISPGNEHDPNHSIVISLSNLPHGRNYRLYYAVYAKDNAMYAKGHGDIRLD